MAEGTNSSRLQDLIAQRVALETKLQKEPGELSERAVYEYDRQYTALQRSLAKLFRDDSDEQVRVSTVLELMRILENRLVYLRNFVVDSTSDDRALAGMVTKFIETIAAEGSTVVTPLEQTYYRGISALYAGDVVTARASFQKACESEESDEANDIKYKSYVILGHLSHEASDFAGARDLHDQSMRYTQQGNVTAQAFAFKALNSYALQEYDEALSLFEKALELFDRNAPFFNSYFYRNALLFCGAIYYDRKDYRKAESYYAQVAGEVEPSSYDYFDALSHLGKIHYLGSRFDDAASEFQKAIDTHKQNENEYLVDLYYWLARTQLRRNDVASARDCLQKIADSDVHYDKRPQAMELLQRVS